METENRLSTKQLMDLVNTFIDDRIDLYGLCNTILYLMDQGLSKDDLIALNFDEDDIIEALHSSGAELDIFGKISY